jgi:cytosine/adenosine deaminase-related metal-dependent hydrolase
VTGTIHRAPWVLTLDGPPLPDGEVAVAGGVVVGVGRDLAGTGPTAGWPTTDHDGVLLPGLVNAHAHLLYGPSFADLAVGGIPFADWIVQLLPRRRAMSLPQLADDMRASAGLALASGTTAVADLVSDRALLDVDTGLGGRRYLEVAGRDESGWAADRGDYLAVLDADPGVGVSPHTLYTLDDAVVRDLSEIARSGGRRLHPHLAETAQEAEYVLAGTGVYADLNARLQLAMTLAAAGSGRTPTGHLDALGGLGPDVHVAHGVHVDAADRALLRRHGTAVALCTRSNAILGAGAAPVAAYRREGNPVAVGTDSLASSPDLDLLAELRALERLARDQGSDPAGLAPWLVRAATVGGSRALGLGPGTITPGARADLVVVQGEGSDPYERVVAGHAVATYLAGERA